MDDDSAKPRNVDISRYIEGGTRLSAEELRPGLSAITFQADIYMCVRVSRSIERVDSIQEIDVRFEQATTSSRLPKGRGGGRIRDRVVYDASSIFSSSWKDEDRKDRTRVINGRGGEDRFRIDDGRGNRGSKTLRSAHKYVNAIQEDNEPLKVVQRRLSGSCVPANLIAVVFTGV